MAKQITYTIDIDGEQRVLKTLADITRASQDIGKAMQKGLPVGIMTNNLNKVDAGLKKVAVSAVKTGNSLKQVTGTTNKAGIAMMNMNFVVRDSPFFFKDMQLGVLAVGNNINPLIDSFINLRKEAKRVTIATGKTTTAFSMLKKSMMGGLGLSLAMSVIVTGIQAVVFSMESAAQKSASFTEKLKKLWSETFKAKEAFRVFKEELREFNAAELAESMAVVEKQVKDLGDPGLWTGFIFNMKVALGFGTDAALAFAEEFVKLNRQLTLGAAITGRKNLIDRVSNEVLGKNKVQIKEMIRLHGLLNLEIGFVVKNLRDQLRETKAGSKESIILKETITALNEAFKLPKLEKATKKVKKLTEAIAKLGEVATTVARLPDDLGLADNFVLGQEKMAEAQDTVIDKHKEAKKEMGLLTTVSNQVGSALVNAMMTGEFAIQNMIKAILAAIVQMLILRAITNAIFGGVPLAGGIAGGIISTITGGASKATAGISLPSGGQLNSSSGGSLGTVRVEGTLRANKNEFVADFNRASEVFNNKVAGRNVGRS